MQGGTGVLRPLQATRISSGQMVMELLLHEAASNGDDKKLEELQIYIRRGKLQVNQPDEEWGNRTPLHWAAERGNPKCVKLLLEAGADPAAKMVGGWTPGHCAAEAGRADNIEILMDYTPLDMADDYGDTPKNVAEIYGHRDCVELLQRAPKAGRQKTYSTFKSKKLWKTVQTFTQEVQETVRKISK